YIVTFVPSRLRCNVAEMNPGAWRTEVSVARASRSTSSSWLAGSTVKTFMSVTGGLFMRLPASIAALRPCYAKRHSGTPNGEVEGPHAVARTEPRAQNVSPRSRRHCRASRPLQRLLGSCTRLVLPSLYVYARGEQPHCKRSLSQNARQHVVWRYISGERRRDEGQPTQSTQCHQGTQNSRQKGRPKNEIADHKTIASEKHKWIRVG